MAPGSPGWGMTVAQEEPGCPSPGSRVVTRKTRRQQSHLGPPLPAWGPPGPAGPWLHRGHASEPLSESMILTECGWVARCPPFSCSCPPEKAAFVRRRRLCQPPWEGAAARCVPGRSTSLPPAGLGRPMFTWLLPMSREFSPKGRCGSASGLGWKIWGGDRVLLGRQHPGLRPPPDRPVSSKVIPPRPPGSTPPPTAGLCSLIPWVGLVGHSLPWRRSGSKGNRATSGMPVPCPRGDMGGNRWQLTSSRTKASRPFPGAPDGPPMSPVKPGLGPSDPHLKLLCLASLWEQGCYHTSHHGFSGRGVCVWAPGCGGAGSPEMLHT